MTRTAPDLATPKERRARRQAETARVLARSLEHHGISRAELAAKAGVPDQHGREWADPETNRNIAVADAAAAPHLVRVDLCEHIMGPGWCVAVLPATGARAEDDVRHAARIAQGGGVVVSKLLAAIADGQLDRTECTDIRAALREHIRELVSLDAGLEAGERTMGRPVEHAPKLRVAGGSER